MPADFGSGADSQTPPATSAVGPLATTAEGRRVLVVDDNEDAADRLVAALTAKGHETRKGEALPVVARRQAGMLTWSELPRDLLRLIIRHGFVNAGSELVELVLMKWIDAHHVSADCNRVRAEATVHNHAT